MHNSLNFGYSREELLCNSLNPKLYFTKCSNAFQGGADIDRIVQRTRKKGWELTG